MQGVELTRIINVQITLIGREGEDKIFSTKEKCAEKVKQNIKQDFGADDVLVTDVKDFLREVSDADM